MSERACIRGCVAKDAHQVGCTGDPGQSSFSGDRCPGCVVVPALEGAMICGRCSRNLRHVLQEAPDLCSHLRSLIDPMKAAVYDREKLGGRAPSESQPPMSADLVDAADEVLAILTYFAEAFGDEMDYAGRHTFEAGTESEAAYYQARVPAGFLLEQFDRIANDHRVEGFARAVLGPPVEEDGWTIAKALRRWPMQERARFAKLPCPGCELRAVLVRPQRRAGDERAYECRGCGWVPPHVERDLWALYFEQGVAA